MQHDCCMTLAWARQRGGRSACMSWPQHWRTKQRRWSKSREEICPGASCRAKVQIRSCLCSTPLCSSTKRKPNVSSVFFNIADTMEKFQIFVWLHRSSLEQALCERNKLRQDLAEANERASLLAQEVDDRHMRLEDSFKKQIG